MYNSEVEIHSPGLYDSNNNIIYTWGELIVGNHVIVNNNSIISVSESLIGTKLGIPEGITAISSNVFYS